jgi:D-alanyl-D-alanine carboxypeptidase (penicillin-binding protein 5/6)
VSRGGADVPAPADGDGRAAPTTTTTAPERDARRRALFRRRRAALAAVVVVVLAVGTYVPVALLSPLAPAAAAASTWEAPAPLEAQLAFPAYGATAVEALGFDESLTTSGDSLPRPIASISKVVTALVVLDAKPLDGGDGPAITLTADDAALYDAYRAVDGKVVPMTAGSVLTERQLLEVTLIESANNYATTLARWAFGSDAAFVAAASAWLAENGLAETTIVEPTGLSPQNTSTATDLVALGALALADADVAAIVGTDETTVPGVGVIDNSNELLGLDGVKGIKTGTLDEAGACLLFAADYTIAGETVTVVGVVLGGVDHDALDVDVQRLLQSVTGKFQTVRLTTEDDVWGRYELPWGASAQAVAADDAELLVWGDEAVTSSVETDEIGPEAAGSEVGRVRFDVGGEEVDVPLVLDATVPEPGAWWRLTHPGDVLVDRD